MTLLMQLLAATVHIWTPG